MNKGEIKKALYKEKPEAHWVASDGHAKHYTAKTSLGEVAFEVPFDDMGTATFNDVMPAQLLVRWLKQPAQESPESVLSRALKSDDK